MNDIEGLYLDDADPRGLFFWYYDVCKVIESMKPKDKKNENVTPNE